MAISKNGKNGNGDRPRHCADHGQFIENIAEIKRDIKWIIRIMNKNGGESLDDTDRIVALER